MGNSKSSKCDLQSSMVKPDPSDLVCKQCLMLRHYCKCSNVAMTCSYTSSPYVSGFSGSYSALSSLGSTTYSAQNFNSPSLSFSMCKRSFNPNPYVGSNQLNNYTNPFYTTSNPVYTATSYAPISSDQTRFVPTYGKQLALTQSTSSLSPSNSFSFKKVEPKCLEEQEDEPIDKQNKAFGVSEVVFENTEEIDVQETVSEDVVDETFIKKNVEGNFFRNGLNLNIVNRFKNVFHLSRRLEKAEILF